MAKVKTKHQIIALQEEAEGLFKKFRHNCPDHVAEEEHWCHKTKLVPSMEPTFCGLARCPRIEKAKQRGGEQSA